MAVNTYEKGDSEECPHCGKVFEFNHISDDELDDFDEYFEHVTTCDGGACEHCGEYQAYCNQCV